MADTKEDDERSEELGLRMTCINVALSIANIGKEPPPTCARSVLRNAAEILRFLTNQPKRRRHAKIVPLIGVK